MARVLVMDSDSRAALAAVRALGRRGHHVVTAGQSHPSLASVSRFSSAFEPYPSPQHDPEGFEAAVMEIVGRKAVNVLLPMTEITTRLMTGLRSRLPGRCQLPFPDAEAVAAASDKAHVVVLAQELQVPVPQTMIVYSAVEASGRLRDWPFPVVVKPSRSRVQTGSGWISTGVRYAPDEESLDQLLGQLPQEVYPVLLQERIGGPGQGIFACYDGGRPVALFSHRRLREKPPSGGVSVLCESTVLDSVAEDYATRLLTRLGWHGVAMVEFKQDLRDGSLKLMEINARFWGSLQLAIDAGVDFPSIVVGIATGDRLPPNPVYRPGVRSRWLAGDLDALLMQLGRSRRALNLPPSHPTRRSALWDFLHLWGSDLRYEIERRDDPGPAQLEWKRRFLAQ